MRIGWTRTTILWAAVGFPASSAFAQTSGSDKPAPPPLIPADLSGGSSQTALQPVTFQLAPSVDGDYVPPATLPSNLFHEGAYLTHRDGKLFHDTDGSLLFQPDPLGPPQPDQQMPTLKLLPSRQKTAVEPLLNGVADVRVTLSGLVTAYNEQNYLLVTVATRAATSQPVDTDDATLASAKTPPTTRPNPATMPATDLLDQMLAPTPATARPLSTGTTSLIDMTSGENAVAPNAKSIDILREGLYVVDRTGRLQKTAGSDGYEFVFETDGKGMTDPPMVVLPNLKLMSMEQTIRGTGRDIKFRITGQVTEYNGRNYLLLEKVIIPPDTAQQF